MEGKEKLGGSRVLFSVKQEVGVSEKMAGSQEEAGEEVVRVKGGEHTFLLFRPGGEGRGTAEESAVDGSFQSNINALPERYIRTDISSERLGWSATCILGNVLTDVVVVVSIEHGGRIDVGAR